MSALFNFQSLLTVVLLLICTCAYIRSIVPSILDRNKTGCDYYGLKLVLGGLNVINIDVSLSPLDSLGLSGNAQELGKEKVLTSRSVASLWLSAFYSVHK